MFAALAVLLGRYDVAAIGPGGTAVGFSHINQRIHEMTGVNMQWYVITDYFGYLAIGICCIFALAGLVQLIRRRSLLKVDGEILALGVLFAVVIGFYVFFEKHVINYRPVIMPGESAPEASFPSSHTVLIITVMIAVMIIIEKYVRGLVLGGLIKAACVLVTLVTVCGRLYSGVHWFTDIVGGVLLSMALLFLFAAVVAKIEEKTPAAGSDFYRSAIKEKDRVIDGYRCKH